MDHLEFSNFVGLKRFAYNCRTFAGKSHTTYAKLFLHEKSDDVVCRRSHDGGASSNLSTHADDSLGEDLLRREIGDVPSHSKDRNGLLKITP